MVERRAVSVNELQTGQTVNIQAGRGHERFDFKLKVVKPGTYPLCELTQKGPDGKIVGPTPVLLEGSGRWTTDKENPVQGRSPFGDDEMFTISYGNLHEGDFLTLLDPDEHTPIERRRAYLMPEISHISIR